MFWFSYLCSKVSLTATDRSKLNLTNFAFFIGFISSLPFWFNRWSLRLRMRLDLSFAPFCSRGYKRSIGTVIGCFRCSFFWVVYPIPISWIKRSILRMRWWWCRWWWCRWWWFMSSLSKIFVTAFIHNVIMHYWKHWVMLFLCVNVATYTSLLEMMMCCIFFYGQTDVDGGRCSFGIPCSFVVSASGGSVVLAMYVSEDERVKFFKPSMLMCWRWRKCVHSSIAHKTRITFQLEKIRVSQANEYLFLVASASTSIW